MRHPSVQAYNSLIYAYRKGLSKDPELWKRAVGVLRRMGGEGVEANAATYAMIILMCCQAGLPEKAV
jgi:hypothetical protein